MLYNQNTIPLRVNGSPTQRRVVKVTGWGERLVWWVRLLGGMRKGANGLWMTHCHSLMGVGGSLDVVFLRPDGTVLKVVPRLQPWHGTVCRNAGSVLALRAGLADRLGVRPGVALDLQV
jgi:hypothetical protein